MRTLLTGAKGQLARCLRDRLPEDWELIATDSTSLDITDTEAVHHMIKTSNRMPSLMPQLTLPSIKQKKTQRLLLPSTQPLFTTWPQPPAPHTPALSIFPLIMYSTAKANALTAKPTTPIRAALTVNPK